MESEARIAHTRRRGGAREAPRIRARLAVERGLVVRDESVVEAVRRAEAVGRIPVVPATLVAVGGGLGRADCAFENSAGEAVVRRRLIGGESVEESDGRAGAVVT